MILAYVLSAPAIAQSPPDAEQRGVATAAELFDLFGMDDAFFKRFRAGEAWDETEDDPLARVLVRLSQIKPVDLARWTVGGVGAKAIDPERLSAQFFRLDGRVRRVMRIKASVEQQDHYNLEKYYRCEIVLADDSGTVVVFAGNVPENWSLDKPISEPASANALLLKRGRDDQSRSETLYFAADRVAWHPDTVLGNLGMDYGLFDAVRHDRAIVDSERECFYQLLAAVGRAPAGRMEATFNSGDATSRLVALVANPEAHEGELHSFRGVARRAVKIHVDDPETVARFGIDHYFELVVFVELDGYQEIAGKKVSNHPVVFCVRKLPAEMPTGENMAEMVRASGFMFKKWRYRTQLAGKHGEPMSVASPLLIGTTAEWERPEEGQRRLDPIMGGFLVATIACIAVFAWWYSRRERRLHNALLARRRTISESSSLEKLELDSIDAATDVDRD
jgi:hypothetical protein